MNITRVVLSFSLLSFFANAQYDSSLVKYRFNQQINYYSYDSVYCKPYHVDSLIKTARKYTGVPYLSEGKTESGFDCSGFLFFLHKPYCIYLPYFSFQYEEIGTKIELKDAIKGDFILFKGNDLSASHTGHVGMVVSNKGEAIKFIHASSSHGIREDKLKGNTYFEPRFLELRRIISNDK